MKTSSNTAVIAITAGIIFSTISCGQPSGGLGPAADESGSVRQLDVTPSARVPPDNPAFEQAVGRFRAGAMELLGERFVEFHWNSGTGQLELIFHGRPNPQRDDLEGLARTTRLTEHKEGSVALRRIDHNRTDLLEAHQLVDDLLVREGLPFSMSFIDWASGTVVVRQSAEDFDPALQFAVVGPYEVPVSWVIWDGEFEAAKIPG